MKNKSSEKIIILYHGNAGSVCNRGYVKDILEKTGASLLFVEYAGYANDTQTPSQKLILNDVRNIQHYLQNNHYQKVVVYGESIGSGPASYHASLGTVDQLILVAPFSRLKDIATDKFPIYPIDLLLTENYDNISWLTEYMGDVAIFHGNKDDVIPHEFSQKLFDGIPSKNKSYFLIDEAGHNDIFFFPIFQNQLLHIINT